MNPATIPLITILWIGIATVDGGAIASETAEEAKPAKSKHDNARPPEVAAAKVDEAKEFVPPPGFVTKKRGKFVLYCKRDTTIGTRIKTEACYDEQQIRDYLLALQESKSDVDRIRATCSNACVCGSPESC